MKRSGTSLALGNLRALVIMVVVAPTSNFSGRSNAPRNAGRCRTSSSAVSRSLQSVPRRSPRLWTERDVGPGFLVADHRECSEIFVLQSFGTIAKRAKKPRTARWPGVRYQRCCQRLPGALYAFAALDAFSATALNSRPVQARAVDMSEIVPAAAAPNIAAITDSASSASVIHTKSLSPVVK
jgi:hypothetical protein